MPWLYEILPIAFHMEGFVWNQSWLYNFFLVSFSFSFSFFLFHFHFCFLFLFPSSFFSFFHFFYSFFFLFNFYFYFLIFIIQEPSVLERKGLIMQSRHMHNTCKNCTGYSSGKISQSWCLASFWSLMLVCREGFPPVSHCLSIFLLRKKKKQQQRRQNDF